MESMSKFIVFYKRMESMFKFAGVVGSFLTFSTKMDSLIIPRLEMFGRG